MTRWLLALAVWLAGATACAAQGGLEGSYFGVDSAEGLRLSIRRDGEGFAGTLTDAAGTSQSFTAEDLEGSARTLAVLDLNGRPAILQISPHPMGVSVAWTPVDPTGAVQLGETMILGFLREGTALPELPEFYVDPPSRPGALVSGNAFLLSYEFWPPDGLVRGYQALPEKYRSLMRMFPLVQLDVIWKLCLSPTGGPAQARALRGQQLTCGEVISQFTSMQRDGRFNRFKADLAVEKEVFITVVRCADAYPMTKQQCDNASRQLSTRAVSMDTAAGALARYR